MSAGAQCLLDGRPTGDGAHLCRGCTDRLRHDLDVVPAVVADLLVTLSRQDHVDHATKGRGSSDPPLVFDDGASKAIADLTYYLGSWTRCIAEDLGLGLDGVADNAMSTATWLRARLRLVRHHPAVDDLAVEIGSAVADARRAVDLAPTSSRFVVGPCPRLLDGAFCDGEVLASIATGHQQDSTMRCLRCDHEWGAMQWLRAGKLIKNRSDEIGWSPRRRQPKEAQP